MASGVGIPYYFEVPQKPFKPGSLSDPATPVTRHFAARPIIRELPARNARKFVKRYAHASSEDSRLRYARVTARVQSAAAARCDSHTKSSERRAQRARDQRSQSSVRVFRA